MHPLITDFMLLFRGYKKAHGIYKVTGEVTEANKRVGKAATIHRSVTSELWNAHLNGLQGLGIIPIDENSQVHFGAIDVDLYPLDIRALARQITKLGLPLVCTRSKSGGAHLWLFVDDAVDAKIMHTKLRELAAYLGHGNSEIYPKQTKILAERGDLGQWINMPFFNTVKSDRHGYNDKGEEIHDAEVFIKFAQSRMLKPENVEGIKINVGEELDGGPPCLKHLITQGFPSGTRNNGLFNLAVYARKKNPDGWKKHLEEYNHQFMDPPLSPVEVLGVIKSVDRKDYTYTCKTPPISSYCDQSACRKCKYGIGGGDKGLPKLGTLSKLNTHPPVWFIDIEGGGRLELTTDDLQTPLKFQARCMEALNVMPGVLKREDWQEIVQKLLQEVSVIEVASEATPRGQFLQHLEEFCTARAQAATREEILLSKPWFCKGFHYFRLKDFLKYIDRQRFEMPLNSIALILKDLGATRQFFLIKGKGVNCTVIPEFGAQQTEEFDTPDLGKKDVI